MSLIFGMDSTKTQRPILCNTDGSLELTAELDSSGLATSANQTNGTQKAMCMGGETDGTQQQLLVSNLGVLQTLDSEVFGKTSQIANQTTLSNTNEAVIIANQTNGTQLAKCMGSEDPTDPAGTQKQLHVDGNGNILSIVSNTVNIAPSNDTNGHITDDPANSVAVALTGRQTIGTATTQTFLKCNASGELLTSGGGGGGGSSTYTLEQQSAATGTIQIIGDGNGSQYIDTNGGSKFVVVVQTNDGSGSPEVSVEWSDNTSFSVNQVFVCNGFSSGIALISALPLSASSRVDFSTLTSQAIFFYDTIPARYARITVRQTSGSAITYTGKTTLSP